MKREGDRSKAARGGGMPPSQAPQTAVKLIAFLGNPGRQYARTRHNVGWMVADELTSGDGAAWKEKFHGVFLKRRETTLLKPHTFMNRSGQSVQSALSFFALDTTELAVVHDDLETPFGTVALTWGGGHRGNNGVRSVMTQLGDSAFWRLRIGVGRPPERRKPGDWLLERFSPEEEAHLPSIVAAAAAMVGEYRNRPRVVLRHIPSI
ncbi:MAG: aminoacyl-tRNA hydrolase [Spirochaetales bacterium]|nr:aminoacyl-tRNA hydrolase [Spirochaetales bacterium]